MLGRALLCAACASGVVAAGVAPAHAAFPGQNGKLAFVRVALDFSSPPDIWTMSPNGHHLAKLTEGSEPKWSADGRRIVFTSGRDGDDEVFVMDADGSHVRQLTFNQAGDGTPAWSPDGRRIAFARDPEPTSPDSNIDIWTMN